MHSVKKGRDWWGWCRVTALFRISLPNSTISTIRSYQPIPHAIAQMLSIDLILLQLTVVVHQLHFADQNKQDFVLFHMVLLSFGWDAVIETFQAHFCQCTCTRIFRMIHWLMKLIDYRIECRVEWSILDTQCWFHVDGLLFKVWRKEKVVMLHVIRLSWFLWRKYAVRSRNRMLILHNAGNDELFRHSRPIGFQKSCCLLTWAILSPLPLLWRLAVIRYICISLLYSTNIIIYNL